MKDVNTEAFIRSLYIMNKQTKRLEFFNLNPAQLQLLEALQSSNRILVVKARQLGITTLIRAFQFSQCYFAQEPIKLGVIAHTKESAEAIHSMDRTFYSNLPAKLQRKLATSTTKTIAFKDTKAELKCFTAGAHGGTRSFAFAGLHMSEFPFWHEGDVEKTRESLATITAAVGESQMIIESSPNMSGDVFHELVTESLAGRNEWKVLFFPWTIHPHYTSTGILTNPSSEELSLRNEGLTDGQLLWRRTQIATLGRDKFVREFPRTIEEAFMGGKATAYFWDEKAIAVPVVNLGSREIRPYADAQYNPSYTYTLGADVSAGVGLDSSTITVVCNDTMQPVYHYVSNRITPNDFAVKVYEVGSTYGTAKVIVENNSYGKVVNDCLQSMRYKNLWTDGDGKRFNTTSKSRDPLFANMKQLISDGVITRWEATLAEQVEQCTWLNNRPDHPDGCHDDLLFATMLAYWGTKGKEGWLNKRMGFIDSLIKKAAVRDATVPLPFKPKGYDWRNRKKPY